MPRKSLEPRFYVQVDNTPFPAYHDRAIVLRAAPRAATAAMTAVRAVLRTEFPGARTDAATMAASMESEYRPWKLGAVLFTLFGVLALVVAGIGVYSSVSYAVSQRTREFGVRVALGATTRDVLAHVLGGGLRTVAIGVAVGHRIGAGGRSFDRVAPLRRLGERPVRDRRRRQRAADDCHGRVACAGVARGEGRSRPGTSSGVSRRAPTAGGNSKSRTSSSTSRRCRSTARRADGRSLSFTGVNVRR